MISRQPLDPREAARGLQWCLVLRTFCVGTSELLRLAGNHGLAGLVAALGALFGLGGYVAAVLWLLRCWPNAELLAPGELPFGRGWAIAGWLVPGLSLWMRWRILLTLWRTAGVPSAPTLVHVSCGLEVLLTAISLADTFGQVPTALVLPVVLLSLSRVFLVLPIVHRITTRQVAALKPLAEPVTV